MSQLRNFYKAFKLTAGTSTKLTPPTYEDLSIDENLTELERITSYAQSTIGLRRLVILLLSII
jgi:hypothetical protein